jgi:dTDP-4-dehydrorhamnose reductase
MDISNQDVVFKVIDEIKPDVIINSAAYTAVDKAETDVELAYAVNEVGAGNLAKAANKIGAALVHISTDYVFDGTKNRPYVESDPVNPIGIYGKSKLAGEMRVKSFCNRHIILRTSWVFGQHGNNFVKTMLRLGRSHDRLSIVGDQFGGPSYSGDIAEAIINIVDMMNNGSELDWGTYHYSGKPYVSWFEFAQKVFSKAKNEGLIEQIPLLLPIPSSEYPTPAKRPQNSRLCCNKIKQTFDINPSDWIAALEKISDYS